MSTSGSAAPSRQATAYPTWLILCVWIIAHVIAFPAGTALRGDDPNSIVGNILFGLTFGGVQAILLVVAGPLTLFSAGVWAAATSLCFTVGTRLASRVSLALASDVTVVGVLYGIVVGTVIGSVQVYLLRLSVPRYILWWPVVITAWIAGESVAFGTGFVSEGVPFVGLAIGLVTAIGLFLLSVVRRKDSV